MKNDLFTNTVIKTGFNKDILLQIVYDNLTLSSYTALNFQGCILIFDWLGACFLGHVFFWPPGT